MLRALPEERQDEPCPARHEFVAKHKRRSHPSCRSVIANVQLLWVCCRSRVGNSSLVPALVPQDKWPDDGRSCPDLALLVNCYCESFASKYGVGTIGEGQMILLFTR